MNFGVVLCQFCVAEEVISIKTIRKVVIRQICPTNYQSERSSQHCECYYPERMISSSTPYSFICCSPHPSLMRLGIQRFFSPVRLEVWYMRIWTRSPPKSVINGANKDAVVGSGVSRVPRSASLRKDTLRSGLFCSAVRIEEIWAGIQSIARSATD